MEPGYVIMRGGMFLRPPPVNGWTRWLRGARRYKTYNDAKREAAENENVVSVLDLLQPAE